MAAAPNGDLFPEARNPEGTAGINERCLMRTQDGHCVVLVSGIVLAQYALTDRMAEAHAMVSLVEQGWANQNEVARAFACSARTVRRHQRRFEEGGLAALGQTRRLSAWARAPGRCAATAGPTTQSQRVLVIAKSRGGSGSARKPSANCCGVWAGKRPRRFRAELPFGVEESAHPNLSGFASATALSPLSILDARCGPKPVRFLLPAKRSSAVSHDTDPSDRGADRLLARLGLLEDAPPLFGSATAVPRAGVLLALPVLVASGVFECAQKIYGSLGPAFYGLRTSLLTLLLMALWRIKRPEGLKEYSPQDLGRVLGLDRAPEVKTLRRKLARLAAAGRAAQFGQALAQQRVALRGEALGFLYTDGHVRVYHGQHTLAQGPCGAHAHLAAGHFGLLGQR